MSNPEDTELNEDQIDTLKYIATLLEEAEQKVIDAQDEIDNAVEEIYAAIFMSDYDCISAARGNLKDAYQSMRGIITNQEARFYEN